MPRRVDQVTIALSRGELVIPWASREQLIDRIGHDPAAEPIVNAFQAAGSSAPVQLDPDGKRLLVGVIEQWMHEGTLAGLPDGLLFLRNELRNDLRGTEPAVEVPRRSPPGV